MREVTIHTIDYTDAVTAGVLLPQVLPIEDLREMLLHIEETLPSTMHLPISSKDALHFYKYLYTHILNADEQFLLLIDVPIQDYGITTGNIQSVYSAYISWKFLSTLQHTKQILGHNA